MEKEEVEGGGGNVFAGGNGNVSCLPEPPIAIHGCGTLTMHTAGRKRVVGVGVGVWRGGWGRPASSECSC